MTATTRLVLPYPPSVNNLYATVNGRRVKSREGRRYLVVAQQRAIEQGVTLMQGDLYVTYAIYMPRKSDLDNRVKACQDALKGLAWKDDIQVAAFTATRYSDKHNPRVEVTIEQVFHGK
jgi:crossover junction endodeoxyribonuclease RusA